MFVKAIKENFTWPVVYRMPTDGGEFEENEFLAIFKLLPQDEMDQILAKARTAGATLGAMQAAALDLDNEILDKAFVGWKDVQLPDGSAFEVTPENRANLLRLPGMRSALVLAFFSTINGQAARKN